MSVVFRVDANPIVGIGHLMRCLALAQALDEQRVDVAFLVSEQAVNYAHQRHDWVGAVYTVPCFSSDREELAWILNHSQIQQCAMLVIDGYQYDEDYRQTLAQHVPKLVCFDDANLNIPLHADIVINGAQQLADYYQRYAPQAKLCCGEEYRVLRSEFHFQPQIPFEQRMGLTLVFGGSDVADLTLPLLMALAERQADMSIRVLTGAAYPRLDTLQKFLRSTDLPVQHLHDFQQVADAFSRSRLVVSAAGGSQFEILATSTPALLCLVADNQQAACRQSTAQGWCEVIDVREKNEPEKIADAVMMLWADQNRLALMQQQAAQLADCQGAQRVVAAMFELMDECQ